MNGMRASASGEALNVVLATLRISAPFFRINIHTFL